MSDTARPIRLGIWTSRDPLASAPVLDALPGRYHPVLLAASATANDLDRDLDLLWIDGVTGAGLALALAASDAPTVVRVLPDELAGAGALGAFDWSQVDRVVLDSAAHEALLRELHPGLLPPQARTHVLAPAVDVERIAFAADRARTSNVGWQGTLDAASAALLAELLAALVGQDAEAQLHVAGPIADAYAARQLAYRAERMGADDHLHLYGALASGEEAGFFAQCSHVVVTDESGAHPETALRALAAGCRAVVRDYEGARDVFPPELIWNTASEAAAQVAQPVQPAAYRAFAADHYDRPAQVADAAGLLDRLFADADPSRAARLLAAVPTHTGEAARVRYADAVAASLDGRPADALALMDGLDLSALSSDELAAAHVFGLRLALECDASARALAHADAALDVAPDEPLALNLAGRALWSAGHDRSALEVFVAAAERADAPAALPFDAEQVRRDAADAARAMGLDAVANQFTPTPLAA